MQYRLTCLCALVLGACSIAYSQDKIYTKDGRILLGKVTEVGPKEIKYTVDEGPVYVVYTVGIDSIVYPSGRVDLLGRKGPIQVTPRSNEPLLNTISADVFGMIFNSFSLSYERKIANNTIGLRFPLYINVSGAGIAGLGTFNTSGGVYYYNDNAPLASMPFEGEGFCLATGINPKFYLLKHRIVRPFIGPEADIGISVDKSQNNNSYPLYPPPTTIRLATLTAMVKFGLSICPRGGAFNITIDGGVGAGDFIGNVNAIEWTGLWHIGFALGGSFNAKLFNNGFP